MNGRMFNDALSPVSSFSVLEHLDFAAGKFVVCVQDDNVLFHLCIVLHVHTYVSVNLFSE